MTGDLTLGTDKITLGVDGTAIFTSSVEIQDVTIEGAFGYSIVKTGSAGFWSPDNWYFGPDVSDPSSAVITLNATDGSATFADSVNVMPASGVSRVNLSASSGEIFCATANTDATPMVRVQGGRGSGNQNDNVVLYADGSAEFAGQVTSGADPSGGAGTGAILNQTGVVKAGRAAEGDVVWQGFYEGTGAATSSITASGSATFAGPLEAASIDGGSY